MADLVRRITSKDNFIIKRIRQLEVRKYREKFEQFIIEGPTAIREALDCQADISFVLYNDSFLKDPEPKEMIYDLLQLDIPVYSVDDRMFFLVSGTTTPQGVLAVIDKRKWEADILQQSGANLLILDRLTDPGNLGTILRTAEAAGFKAVISLKGTVAPYGAKVARAAAGALLRMPIFFAESPEEVAALLKKGKKRMLCTSPRAELAYYDVNMSRDIALVIGNEASGICDELFEVADEIVTIPMEGDTESLNAGVASAILMYESMRQRKKISQP